MAILRGFPPSNTISPSVRIAEKDLSFIAPEQTFHRAALVGFASKGPMNVPTVVATSRQLHTIFGFPHPDVGDPYLLYAAEQYLLVANELYVVRVGDTDPVSDEAATTAEVDVPAAGTLIKIESQIADTYTFDDDAFFRWRLNGNLSPKTLVVLAESYTTQELVTALNDQLDFANDGIEFYVTDANTLGVKSVWAYGPESELELVSVHDAMYGGGSAPSGLGTGMTQASVTGDVATPFDFTGLTGMNLQVVVDGTDNVLIDNVVQTIDLSALTGSSSAAQVVAEINNQLDSLPGGLVASVSTDFVKLSTKHHGRDARLRVKPASTAAAMLGLDTKTHIGTSGAHVAVTGDVDTNVYGRCTGAANEDGTVTFTVNADSHGIEGNNTVVRITNNVHDNNFTLEVFNNGVQLESWGNLTKDTTSRFYVETYLGLVSDWVRVTDNTDEGAGPANGLYTLAGGSDGIPSDPDDQDALLIGSPVGFTGMYCVSEPEQIDIDLLACPGHASTSVVRAMLDVVQNYRMDSMAIVDAPFGLTVKEIIAWQNGVHPLNGDRFDSDFGALYWPWVKMRDFHNQIDVWVPPSGAVMAVYARNDSIARPWFAPAGLTRGVVPNIADVYSKPTLEERDLMYGYRNCVNPIVHFNDIEGFVVWGQKTLQRKPTALDRVNVRRCMFYLEKRIRTASRELLFDPHDQAFRDRFVRLAKSILTEVQIGHGLTDFIIKADEEINTPDVIDRNEFRARIGVQPTRAAEFIFIEFSIHRTGSFSENTDTF